jgi:hypothetical protein
MSRQYKRAYELTVIPDNGEARVISDLRVNFEITKSLLSYPNLFKINIYNANFQTLSAINSKYAKIIFNAGYEGNLKLLFKGEIRNAFKSRSGVDSIATVYAGDGERDWQNSTFNKTFNSNVTIKSAVEEVIKTFKNLTSGSIEGVPNVADKLRGQSLSGSSKDIMDNFAEEYGFNWSIQNEQIVVTPIEDPIKNDEAILVSNSTGMIGSPTITEIGADVRTLLNPDMLPNRAFKIESTNAAVQLANLSFRKIKKTNAEGLYKVQEVVFKGDSREKDWFSLSKGRTINA